MNSFEGRTGELEEANGSGFFLSARFEDRLLAGRELGVPFSGEGRSGVREVDLGVDDVGLSWAEEDGGSRPAFAEQLGDGGAVLVQVSTVGSRIDHGIKEVGRRCHRVRLYGREMRGAGL